MITWKKENERKWKCNSGGKGGKNNEWINTESEKWIKRRNRNENRKIKRKSQEEKQDIK